MIDLGLSTEAGAGGDLRRWFARCREALALEVERVPMAASVDWRLGRDEAGEPSHVAHRTGRLHRITFLRCREPLRAGAWVDRCMLEPLPEGDAGIWAVVLLARHAGRYLIQAKGEPGTLAPGRVAVTATLQASYTNISMQLSGAVPFVELMGHPGVIQVPVLQDGGHLLGKVNQCAFVDLEAAPAPIPETFAWATLAEIREFAAAGLVTEHLMQALGVAALHGWIGGRG